MDQQPPIQPAMQEIPPAQPVAPSQPPPPVKKSNAVIVLFIFLILFLISASAFTGFTTARRMATTTAKPTPTRTPTPDPTASWKTYVNQKFGYQFKYPTLFKIVTKGNQDQNTADMVNLLPDCSIANGDRCLRLSVFVDQLSYQAGQLLDKYFVYKPGEEPKIINDSHITLDGVQALSREVYDTNYAYGAGLNDKGMVKFTVITTHKNAVYTIEFIEEGKDQKEIKSTVDWKNKAVADQILSTFKFTDQNTDTSNWKTYTNSEIGFSFKYPQEWTLGTTSVPRIASFNTKSGTPGEFFVAYHKNVGSLSKWLSDNRAGEIINTVNINGNQFSVIKGGTLNISREYAIKVNPDNYLRLVVEPYPNSIISDEVLNQILSTFTFLGQNNQKNQTGAQRVNCPTARPQVCTMECLQPPPYICGSDGKNYCTVCQACSNSKVSWYAMQATPCEKQ